jgi:cobalt/nickel transport protein
MIIGIGEAIISTLILVAIVRTKPGLFDSTESGRRMLRGGALTEIIPYGIIVTLGLALFVAPFVTTWPDGLERVAETVGFNARLLTGASGHIPFADYKLPWVGSVPLATAFAAMIGAAVVYLISFLIGRTLLPKPKGSSS